MAYKKLIKVSNVCQVLDKRKYNPSQTRYGITWTNNGDGSWTANGIAEKNFAYANINQNIPFSNLMGHIIYICIDSTNLVSGVTLELKIQDNKGNDLYYRYDIQNNIINLRNISSSVIISISAHAIYKDIILENYTFKPQLFDLTEMYGAGHEPTTVEEFRQKFPEEMYDYSPHCWLTSYKRVFMCKTKNLFDISKVVQGDYIKSDNRDITCSIYGSPIGVLKDLCPALKVGDVVTLSLKVKSTTSVAPKFLQVQGQILYFSNPITFTVTEEGLNSPIYLYNTTFENRNVPTTSVFTDIMIELGDTATDYVPYPLLTSYQRNLTCKTKNLWTCDKTMSHVIYNSGTQVFKVTNTGSNSCYTLSTPIPSGTTLTITVHCLSGFIKLNWEDVTIGGYHNENGNTSWQCFCNLPKNIDLSGKSFSNTVTTTNTLTDFWIFVYYSTPDNLQFKVQLELGDTATEYVPYGHL